jgi:hypothetical protein
MRPRHTSLTLATIGLIAAHLHTHAQTPAHIRILTDQQVYISGDDAWVDGRMDKTSPNCRYTRLRLLDRNGRTRTEALLPIEKTSFTGYLPIPEELPTDTYFLDAATTACPSACQIAPILVVNPRIPPNTNCPNPKPDKPNTPQRQPTPQINIRPDKDSFKPNTPVTLSWTVTHGQPIHDVLCRATRKDALSDRMENLSTAFHLTLTHQNTDPRDDLGHLVRVRITRNGRPIAQLPAMAALQGRQANISTARSDSLGILTFLIPRSNDPSRLVIIPETETPANIQWDWIEPEQTTPIPFPCFPWDTSLQPDLEDRILNSRLERRYHPEGVRSVAMDQTDTSDFYGKPDHRYLLDDYTRFPVMEEVFTEIIPQLRLRKDNGKPILQILNSPFKAFFPTQALILLDGIPIRDAQTILDIDPLQIRSIDVVARTFTLALTEFPGIIHLKSYRSDMAGTPLPQTSINKPFPGIQRPSTYPDPEQKRPSLRNLLWKEHLPAPSGLTTMTMRFMTTDAVGTYRISISGTDAQGKPIQGETSIFVGQGPQ